MKYRHRILLPFCISERQWQRTYIYDAVAVILILLIFNKSWELESRII